MRIKCSFLLLSFLLPLALADLRVGFYQKTCPQAESIVRQVVQKRFSTDRSITAALLRMHFHDCFVRGCDASILIDSTNQKQSEKDAGPNQTVRDYELIDEAKKAIEAACPSTVSCADIITLATRDAVALSGGPSYAVPTGRRDGLVSDVNDVNLPGPTFSVSQAFQFFQAKGLTLSDMVTLLGAHTVGVAHCSFFSDRLSNFQGTGRPDPTMDSALASRLNRVCSSSGSDPTVFLDQNTSFVFDNEYYRQLLLRRGIMQIDQELATDRSSAGIVSNFAANGAGFKQSFANAMVKMAGIEVLVGNAGEIRTNCRVFNPPKKPTAPTPGPPLSPPPQKKPTPPTPPLSPPPGKKPTPPTRPLSPPPQKKPTAPSPPLSPPPLKKLTAPSPPLSPPPQKKPTTPSPRLSPPPLKKPTAPSPRLSPPPQKKPTAPSPPPPQKKPTAPSPPPKRKPGDNKRRSHHKKRKPKVPPKKN